MDDTFNNSTIADFPLKINENNLITTNVEKRQLGNNTFLNDKNKYYKESDVNLMLQAVNQINTLWLTELSNLIMKQPREKIKEKSNIVCKFVNLSIGGKDENMIDNDLLKDSFKTLEGKYTELNSAQIKSSLSNSDDIINLIDNKKSIIDKKSILLLEETMISSREIIIKVNSNKTNEGTVRKIYFSNLFNEIQERFTLLSNACNDINLSCSAINSETSEVIDKKIQNIKQKLNNENLLNVISYPNQIIKQQQLFISHVNSYEYLNKIEEKRKSVLMKNNLQPFEKVNQEALTILNLSFKHSSLSFDIEVDSVEEDHFLPHSDGIKPYISKSPIT